MKKRGGIIKRFYIGGNYVCGNIHNPNVNELRDDNNGYLNIEPGEKLLICPAAQATRGDCLIVIVEKIEHGQIWWEGDGAYALTACSFVGVIDR